MGRQLGGESIETCGRWEQTLPSSLIAEVTPRPPEEQFQFQSQQQVQQEVIPAPTLGRPPAPASPGSGEVCLGLGEVTSPCPE